MHRTVSGDELTAMFATWPGGPHTPHPGLLADTSADRLWLRLSTRPFGDYPVHVDEFVLPDGQLTAFSAPDGRLLMVGVLPASAVLPPAFSLPGTIDLLELGFDEGTDVLHVPLCDSVGTITTTNYHPAARVRWYLSADTETASGLIVCLRVHRAADAIDVAELGMDPRPRSWIRRLFGRRER